MKIKGLMGAAAAAMLSLGGFEGTAVAIGELVRREEQRRLSRARNRARYSTPRLGHGTSKQTNHLSVHTHARENERRRRQMARDAAKRGAR